MATAPRGRLLDVDLSTGRIAPHDVPEETLRTYLGGSGLAAKLLYDELDPSLDPLAPASPLVVMNGLLTGTPVICANKVCLCARSPLTGIWGESRAGGFFGAELARTGIMGIILRGQAPEPVYLWLRDGGHAELRPAAHLWGKDTFQTAEILLAETHPRAQVGAIGPAGEALVRFASVIFGGHHARAAGRTGMGALMGAKRLKAIVARGTTTPQVAKPHELLAAMKAENPKARDDAGRLRDFGTAGGIIVVEAAGDLPIKNWQLGSWADQAKRIAPQTHFPRTLAGHYACFACPIRCGKTIRTPNAQPQHAPEYETTAGFGPLLLNEDLHTIFAANHLCNRYGLDTISTAAAIAFAMEAHELGILPEPKATWGDPNAILALIHQIARREGIGRLLGEGVKRAAHTLGPHTASFAIHTKGLEYPFHDPRAFISMAPDYATGNRGSCHLESFSYILGYGSPMPDFGIPRGGVDPHEHHGAPRIAILMQNLMTAYDALGLCKFLARNGTGPTKLAAWLSLVTGWHLTPDDLMTAGERLFNLKRAYNIRCGIRASDDRLPDRFLHLDRTTGGAAGSLPHMERLLPEYYALRGWDARGFPTPQTLSRLGLAEVAHHLAALP